MAPTGQQQAEAVQAQQETPKHGPGGPQKGGAGALASLTQETGQKGGETGRKGGAGALAGTKAGAAQKGGAGALAPTRLDTPQKGGAGALAGTRGGTRRKCGAGALASPSKPGKPENAPVSLGMSPRVGTAREIPIDRPQNVTERDPAAGSGPRIERLPVGQLDANVLSGNTEDDVTFARLRRDLEQWGMLELPVVLQVGDRYRIVAGHHRLRAWQDLGNTTVDCMVLPEGTFDSREVEFSLVNELNRTRGQTPDSELLRIVRREGLTPERVDVFNLPKGLLVTQIDPRDVGALDELEQRKAQVMALVPKIAAEIARLIVDERDEMVTLLVVQDRLAAVLRVPMASSTAGRKLADTIREPLQRMVAEALPNVG